MDTKTMIAIGRINRNLNSYAARGFYRIFDVAISGCNGINNLDSARDMAENFPGTAVFYCF